MHRNINYSQASFCRCPCRWGGARACPAPERGDVALSEETYFLDEKFRMLPPRALARLKTHKNASFFVQLVYRELGVTTPKRWLSIPRIRQRLSKALKKSEKNSRKALVGQNTSRTLWSDLQEDSFCAQCVLVIPRGVHSGKGEYSDCSYCEHCWSRWFTVAEF